MTQASTPAPNLNFWQELELTIEKLVHPEAKAVLQTVVTTIETGKTAWLAEFQASGLSVAAFIQSKATALINEQPVLAPFSGIILSLLTPFVSKEIGYAETDLSAGIDKVTAYLTTLESTV